MAQVAREFQKQKEKLGAREAARQLRVPLSCFYKYAAGEDLPRMEVLRDAQKEWGIKWEHLDPSEILRMRSARSAEQLMFSFIDAVREENVEVLRIRPDGASALRVILRIQFPAARPYSRAQAVKGG